MNWRSPELIFIACLSSLFIELPVKAIPDQVSVPIPQTSELSATQLSQLAKSITVKVFSGETSGSGILIYRQGRAYTVLTNEHVLLPGYGKQYRIQTPDGRIYPAYESKTGKFNGDDLGLLQFSSGKVYAIASFSTVSLCQGDAAFVGGFPFGAAGFVFTTGQVSLLLPQDFEGGYQIGYTNDIRKGMSGGPLLNSQGKLVGINGKHAYPLWGNSYIFQDGSVASELQYQQMSQLSWGIPLQTFLGKQNTEKSSPAMCMQSQPITQPVIVNPKPPNIPPLTNWLW
ncbi:S1 family peptidase [Cylindrospermum sp. FACHB-282]|uniref:S1 family peptidase n=1 Tax=Cylindrospermum sp. FACHB-282 TaxID=2692794 RepID=UPI0016871D12|nr:trypsin-like peptidase domain-containing protein [Cylindrospermum sp. FACHB-282]MBD2384876.1 trypsin-like peptidase domain-containing protein [Cylindrospermum sp. FACHB-282]